MEAYRKRAEPYARSIKRELPSGFIEKFIQEESHAAGLRALAIRYLENPGEKAALLLSVLRTEKNTRLRLEAIRTLAAIPGEDIARQLLLLATSAAEPVPVRAWAIVALARQPPDMSAQILPLLQDTEKDVQLEAARYLRTRIASEGVQQAFRRLADSSGQKAEEALLEQIQLALSSIDSSYKLVNRPAAVKEWQEVLAARGTPARGHRVFYSIQSMCAMCHAVGGRGGDLGPDLSNTGQSKSRTQLVQSVLQPSGEISPEYQGWFVQLKNGEVYQGRQIDIGEKGIELYTQARGFVTFDKKEVADYGMSEKSLMPDGLERGLTVSDMRDLLAFLEETSKPTSNKKLAARTKK